jgi:hypothetical protein
MIQTITPTILSELLGSEGAPCLSLYLPTHRSHPENLQDPIRFKNLVEQLEESLLQQYPADEVTSLLVPFKELENNKDFWNHTMDALAVLSSKEMLKVIGLPVTVQELVVVADSFHTKPLRKFLQSTDRYQVLGLSLHDIHLYEGNRHSIAEVGIPEGIPPTIKDALGDELTEQHLTVASYGGVGGESGNMVHGQGSRKDELDKDAERFFRVIAKAVHEHYSKPSGLPLILAALPEHHNLFRKVSSNSLLLEKGITVNPSSIPKEKFIQLAWEVMEPDYLLKIENFNEKFGTAKADNKGTDQLEEAAKAAAEGRVETLLIEQDREIPGKITDSQTGVIATADLQQPDVDDLLDDIGELVIKMGGKVVVIPKEKMPSQTGLAAILRY